MKTEYVEEFAAKIIAANETEVARKDLIRHLTSGTNFIELYISDQIHPFIMGKAAETNETIFVSDIPATVAVVIDMLKKKLSI